MWHQCITGTAPLPASHAYMRGTVARVLSVHGIGVQPAVQWGPYQASMVLCSPSHVASRLHSSAALKAQAQCALGLCCASPCLVQPSTIATPASHTASLGYAHAAPQGSHPPASADSSPLTAPQTPLFPMTAAPPLCSSLAQDTPSPSRTRWTTHTSWCACASAWYGALPHPAGAQPAVQLPPALPSSLHRTRCCRRCAMHDPGLGPPESYPRLCAMHAHWVAPGCVPPIRGCPRLCVTHEGDLGLCATHERQLQAVCREWGAAPGCV